MAPADYSQWTKDSLIEHIQSLEHDLQVQKAAVAELVPQLPPSTSSSLDPKTSPITAALAHSTLPPSLGGPSALKRKKQRRKESQKYGFNTSVYATRHIALKFAYLGKNYCGYENAASPNAPSVEEKLWHALVKACLINPGPQGPEVVDWMGSGCDYSKCGRTDRGVSAFGQVVGLRVKSNKRLRREKVRGKGKVDGEEEGGEFVRINGVADATQANQVEPPATADVEAAVEEDSDLIPDDGIPLPVHREMQYCKILNRLLPPDIRIYAWCPNPPPDFSARFSCRERQYRYFFTQPAFSPYPTALEDDKLQVDAETGKRRWKQGWLDIEAMKKGAKLLEGLHDFRNLCKLDQTKLLTDFRRRIYECDIVEVRDVNTTLPYLDHERLRDASIPKDGSYPQVYYILVRGTAFLYHQVRHIAAILFMIGQGLEAPEVITKLLDIKKWPAKPTYTMADERPLVLWDCLFGRDDVPETGREGDALDWVHVGGDDPLDLYGLQGLTTEMWQTWWEAKMDEILANRLSDHIAAVTKAGQIPKAFSNDTPAAPTTSKDTETDRDLGLEAMPGLITNRGPSIKFSSQRTHEGGAIPKYIGRHVPLLQRQMNPLPEDANDKYAQRKGFKDAATMRATGNWRAAIKENKAAKLTAAKANGTAVEVEGEGDG